MNRARGQNKNGNSGQRPVEPSGERAGSSRSVAVDCTELGAIAARFRREDVSDPQRVASLVRSTMEELVPEESLMLLSCDRQNIIDWMANDPYLRGRVLEYFAKVLT